MVELCQLVFLSRSRAGLDADALENEIEGIREVSERNNPDEDISGAMLWVDGHYCQVLEGPDETLERRFEIIQQDARHSACKLLRYEPIEARRFDQIPLHVVGVFWEPIPGLSSSLNNLGAIDSNEAADRVVDALLAASAVSAIDQV